MSKRKSRSGKIRETTTVARNNIKMEDMTMAKPELRRCASMHQYFAEGETPFMLVQMSKVIEMQFSRLTK